MATKDIKTAFLELTDDELKRLMQEREQRLLAQEQAKERAGELKATLAHVCTQLMEIGELPDWINVAGASDKNGKVNFYRALKVAKPKD